MIYKNQQDLIDQVKKRIKQYCYYSDVASKIGLTPQDLHKLFLKTHFDFDDCSRVLKGIDNKLYVAFLAPGDEVVKLSENQKNLLTTYEALNDIQKAELRGMLKGMLK